jgi:hypothetical protein
MDYIKALGQANERSKSLADKVRHRIAHLEVEKEEVMRGIKN